MSNLSDFINEQMRKSIEEDMRRGLLGMFGGDINSASVTAPQSLSFDSLRESMALMERQMKSNPAPALFGMKVIQSPYAYETIVKVKGIPAKNKPNSHKPYYRKVSIKKPVIYMINGDTVVTTASMIRNIQMQASSPFTPDVPA